MSNFHPAAEGSIAPEASGCYRYDMPGNRQPNTMVFLPLPAGESLRLAWPTPSRSLCSDPAQYLAQTRANADYGKPGWTRDCGKRFHRGCDIAPARATATGGTTTVRFSDCLRNTEYDSEEKVVIPHDEIFAVAEGMVAEANHDAGRSDFGLYAVLRHAWPVSGDPFFTLYGHLNTLSVQAGDTVPGGARIGTMGQTSRSADARNWMSIAPHLHFEAWNRDGLPYDPLEFLQTYLGAKESGCGRDLKCET